MMMKDVYFSILFILLNISTSKVVEALLVLNTPASSQKCMFFQENFATEYIALLNEFQSLHHHEKYLTTIVSDYTSYGIILEQRPRPFASGQIPTDFVVLKFFSCRNESNAIAQCHGAQSDITALLALDDKKMIKSFTNNQHYSNIQLLSVPKLKRDNQTLAQKQLEPATIDILHIRELWSQGFTGKGIKIAVFDTGVTSGRFKNVKERINWTNEKQVDDVNGHGTFVAGVIAGDEEKCPGISPNSELYIFRVFAKNQVSFTSWFLDAFNYAIFKGIHVINLSIGGPDFRDFPFQDKIRELIANSILVISAVGNKGPNYGTLSNPADQLEVIAVGGIDKDGDVAAFSSRGMTTWELPFGYGRVKPDIVTIAENVWGPSISNGCKALSGTSISTPIVSGVVALLLSMIPEEFRSEFVNPALIKQILIESSARVQPRTENFTVRNHLYEQGSGAMNVSLAGEILRGLIKDFELQGKHVEVRRMSLFPSTWNTSDCPYLWPLCSQPLYFGSNPSTLNLTILNPVSAIGELSLPPKWIPGINGNYLNVSVATSGLIWPFFGSMGISLSVQASAQSFEGFSEGLVRIQISIDGYDYNLDFPISVNIVPTPHRSKRILWDQFHNIQYPSPFVALDRLHFGDDRLDTSADHPHTNFNQMWNFLRDQGWFLEVLPFDYSCISLVEYGTLMLIDPEEEFFQKEIIAIQNAIRYENVSLIIFAEWFDEAIIEELQFFDVTSLSTWAPITGGANIPAVNQLLQGFNIAFGEGIISNPEINLVSTNTTFPYWDGSYLVDFPVGGYLGRINASVKGQVLIDGNTLSNVPILGLYEVPSTRGGRIAVYGDSSCLDESVHNDVFQNCFSMLTSLLDFTSHGKVPDGLEKLKKEFTYNELGQVPRQRTKYLKKFSKTLQVGIDKEWCTFYEWLPVA